jgi:hypothetical protein
LTFRSSKSGREKKGEERKTYTHLLHIVFEDLDVLIPQSIHVVELVRAISLVLMRLGIASVLCYRIPSRRILTRICPRHHRRPPQNRCVHSAMPDREIARIFEPQHGREIHTRRHEEPSAHPRLPIRNKNGTSTWAYPFCSALT